MNCRHCGKELTHTFIDLGSAPPSNSYITESDIRAPEKCYPLKVLVCSHCWLVQTEDYAEAKALFTAEYSYFSSTSSGWLVHAKFYAEKMIEAIDRYDPERKSLIVVMTDHGGGLGEKKGEKGEGEGKGCERCAGFCHNLSHTPVSKK